MCVMENPAFACGISPLAEMGENTGPAASNSAAASLPFSNVQEFQLGNVPDAALSKLSRNISQDN
jgi:hypothetical protein